MLLGVDDLETGQAYPRGKIRLHNAWLHREGVVWGLNVAFNTRGELTVDRGLALDGAGHELHLDRLACVDLGQWYGAHQKDPGFTFADEPGGGKQFSAHVVARFKACLTRPVPSIVEPCVGSQTDTAYSRVFETVELLILPGLSVPKDRGYHRLRVLFAVEDDSAAYADATARRLAIQALPTEQQPKAYLQALREFAALDEIDLAPQAATATEPASIFPEDPTDVVLADIADVIVRTGPNNTWALVQPAAPPIVTVRPSHIATATIQELLCGPLSVGTAPAPAPAPREPQAPSGPTVTDVSLSAKSLTFTTSRAIAPATLEPQAFVVSDYNDTDGWSELDIRSVAVQGNGSVRIDLKEAPAGTLVRLIIRGTGPAPLLSADDHQPLGAPGSSGADDGIDFAKMFKRSE
ncbi:MAG: hypothetical protein WCP29_09990 [Acidobacteriota bacterium]